MKENDKTGLIVVLLVAIMCINIISFFSSQSGDNRIYRQVDKLTKAIAYQKGQIEGLQDEVYETED